MRKNLEIKSSHSQKSKERSTPIIYQFAITIVLGILFGFLIKYFLIFSATVQGSSMYPTYSEGDCLIVTRVGEIERGDIVIIQNGKDEIIKRVIGLPGETIAISDSKVFINGQYLKEDYVKSKNYDGGIAEDNLVVLDKNEYFVMGDNREVSLDSRDEGAFKRENVLGKKLIDLW